ncbi:MCE family protein [Nocardia jinanensis]|uniref:Virulence factor n=1 Tax=Nocardia jinanensis TaxID=382504 RepID=A0A917RND0_9NOCA|nr:MCE family protein [Nocardia jinanensis]GGL15349.1 virulence factor [Nocardia jinanensis]
MSPFSIGSKDKTSRYRPPRYKTAGILLIVALTAIITVCLSSFRGGFDTSIPITVVSLRSGLVLDIGSKVKVHGVEVGRVARVANTPDGASIELAIDPAELAGIPGNVEAEIKPSTVFGAKYVELGADGLAATTPLAPGASVRARTVTTEVNTVFQNISSILEKIDPDQLNATLSAIAEGLQGRGEALGETLSDADTALAALNPRLPQLHSDLRDTATVAHTFGDAGEDLVSILRNATVTSASVVDEQDNLERLLVSAIGLGDSGSAFLDETGAGIVDSMRLLVPTTELLAEYSPSFACLAHLGATTAVRSARQINDHAISLDAGLLFGDDPYTNPQNLPVVAAKGGPHGAPGCYPPVTWDNYPTPYLRMNTGAPLNGPGTYTPRLGSPSAIEFLFGNAIGGPGRP